MDLLTTVLGFIHDCNANQAAKTVLFSTLYISPGIEKTGCPTAFMRARRQIIKSQAITSAFIW
jgi:hypothetical protein